MSGLAHCVHVEGRCVAGELQQLRAENVRLREGVSTLRLHLSIARIFVEGKALVPDETMLMSIDHTMTATKEMER